MADIKIAKTAGFCFGVDRAIKIINDLLSENRKVCTLGPIIHNQQVVDSLAKKGVRIIDNVSEANLDETVVIRSHGVSPDIYEALKSRNIDYVDATCPFVAKAHKIVSDNSTKINTVLIAGDENHPEVKAIRSYSKGKSYVFKNEEELILILENNNYLLLRKFYGKNATKSQKNYVQMRKFLIQYVKRHIYAKRKQFLLLSV